MKSLSSLGKLLLLLMGASLPASGQVWKKILPEKGNAKVMSSAEEGLLTNQLRSDVTILAADGMEGRKAGTKGESDAGMYIEKRMADMGLVPAGKNRTYRQPFKFAWGRQLTPETRISIGNALLSVPEEAIPLPYSSEVIEENYTLPESTEPNSPWLIALYESPQQAGNPGFDWEKVAYEKAKYAQDRGASSVVLYDPYGSAYVPTFSMTSDREQLAIPVVVLRKKAYDAHIKDMRIMKPVYIKIAYRSEFRNATNIIGYINNNAAQTVVIGAHYDHLGFGEEINPPAADRSRLVYNGADDNASGVAAMMALAPMIRKGQFKKYNYIFVAFSAEEGGLWGSKFFLSSNDFDPGKLAYMINIDMVGRLNNRKSLVVGGTGSASVLSKAIKELPGAFELSQGTEALGASAHLSFAKEKIPYLFFSTGSHEDYRKPADDSQKINYTGLKDVVVYIYRAIAQLEKMPRPVFAHQASFEEAVASGSLDGKVTMGILPDDHYEGGGVRIESVMDNQPAEKAGLKEGDILLQLEQVRIEDIPSLNEMLDSYHIGDTITVKVKRGPTVQEFRLTF